MTRLIKWFFRVLVLVIFVCFFYNQFLAPQRENFFQETVCPWGIKLCLDGSFVSRVPPECNFASCPQESLIKIKGLKAYDLITSPLVIKGEARGYWFFEADFPVKLLDQGGKVMAETIAQAQGSWMTEGFVPFEARLEFEVQEEEEGEIVFEKDNPSGLPEQEKELRVPIRFKLK